MRYVRSTFVIAVVSFCILAGYSFDLLGDCCAHEQGHAEHGTPGPGKQPPANDDGCQCICHQVITLTTEPARIADSMFSEGNFVPEAEESAPDAVPRGIDHPPQLA